MNEFQSRTHLKILGAFIFASSLQSPAHGQNASDMMRLLQGLIQGAIVQGAKQRPPLPSVRPAPSIPAPYIAPAPAIAPPLSSSPTFDCTGTRSALGSILCADRAGAIVDWDVDAAFQALKSSGQPAGQETVVHAHQHWIESTSRTCRLNKQPTYSPQQRQCVLNAYSARAHAYRSKLRGDALAEARMSPEERAALQNKLISLGLLHSSADGIFGPVTRDAIQRYQERIGEPETQFLSMSQRKRLAYGNLPPPPADKPVATAPDKPVATAPDKPIATAPENPIMRLPIETRTILEGRNYLNDVQEFVKIQPTHPKTIADLAPVAEALQVAIRNFDESAVGLAMSRLTPLMKSNDEFQEFRNDRQKNRFLVSQQRLVEQRTEGQRNLCVVDTYVKMNLVDPKNSSLLGIRAKINAAIAKQDANLPKGADDPQHASLDRAIYQTTTLASEIAGTNSELESYVTVNKIATDFESLKHECVPKTGKLTAALLACEKQVLDNHSVTLPGGTEEVQLDRCYKGSDHLSCSLAAIKAEAEDINDSYKDIADPEYGRIKDIDSVCRLNPLTLTNQISREAGFAERSESLNKEWEQILECSDKVASSIRKVRIPTDRGADIMKSMLEKIKDATKQVEATQVVVAQLRSEINKSKETLETFKQVRSGGICPASPR
jgi:hypothetical protein